MPEPLTRVEIVFLKTFVNHRLRFGDPLAVDEIDRRRGVALFTPGSVFGYIRWEANKYGTRLWRLTVMQAGKPPPDLRQSGPALAARRAARDDEHP